jgi:hypothetical protein
VDEDSIKDSVLLEAPQTLEVMRCAADWRQMLTGVALAVLVVGITLGGFWLLTPSREEFERAARSCRARSTSSPVTAAART